MRNLLQFLAKHHRLILFILLEVVAVYLIVNSHHFHNAQLIKGVRRLTLAWEGILTDTRNYFRIKTINDDLNAENSALRNIIEKLGALSDSLHLPAEDYVSESGFQYVPALVVNNSYNRQKNFFTISKGKNDSVDINMAVISPWGAAGLTVASSRNFSVVMSLINTDFRLSSKIKSNDYFGSLSWDGRDYRYAVLNDIPRHVSVREGDTIVTTGYSAIFPGNIMVGTISDFEKSGSDFYRIRVLLATDFRRLVYVTVVRNRKREEQAKLEGGYQ